jgi:hypothetical protein
MKLAILQLSYFHVIIRLQNPRFIRASTKNENFGDLDDILMILSIQLKCCVTSYCDKTAVMEMSYIVRRILELSLQSLLMKDETVVKDSMKRIQLWIYFYRKYLRDTINSTENREDLNK